VKRYQGILHLSRKEQIGVREYRMAGFYYIWLVPFSGKFSAYKMGVAIAKRFSGDLDTRYAGRYGTHHILIRELRPHPWSEGE